MIIFRYKFLNDIFVFVSIYLFSLLVFLYFYLQGFITSPVEVLVFYSVIFLYGIIFFYFSMVTITNAYSLYVKFKSRLKEKN